MILAEQLSDPARAAFGVVQHDGEAIRTEIATRSGISLPSATKGIHELLEHGLVQELRHDQGPNGRATIVYGIAPEAGWVLGIDIGATQITLQARGLDKAVHSHQTHQLDPNDRAPLAAARRAAHHATTLASSITDPGSPLRATTLAVNQIVPTDIHNTVVEAPDTPNPTPTSYDGGPSPAHSTIHTFYATAHLPHAPLVIENNVNCAAVAEHQHGALQGHRNAAYLQIGVRIGLGFFLDGALRRGGSGGTGELATIPTSWWNGNPPLTELEHHLGSPGLMQTAANNWPNRTNRPETPAELIALATAGQEPAHHIVTRHATAIGRLAATTAAIIDPSVLALGGGLAHHPHITNLINHEFQQRNQRTHLTTSTTGPTATTDGATHLAQDLALTHLLGNRHTPLLPEPALWDSPT